MNGLHSVVSARDRMVSPLLFALAFPGLVFAAAGAPRPVEEDDLLGENLEEQLFFSPEETVTSAARHLQPLSESPSAVSVITREQIINTHCTDLVCLLRGLPEVDVLSIKPMYASVGARAMVEDTANRALVLIDGQEINDEIFGLVFWLALPVHLEDIERIEVIRGPGSALYGANAHSMVVSIHTRGDVNNLGEVFLGSGERGRTNLHLRLGQRLGSFRVHLSGGSDWQDHWQVRGLNQSEVHRIRLSLDRDSSSGEFSARLGVVFAEGAIHTVMGPTELADSTMVHLLLAHRQDPWKAQLSFNLIDAAIPVEPNDVSYQGIKLGELPTSVPFTGTNLDAECQLNFSLFEDNLIIVGGNYRWITSFSDWTVPGTIFQHRLGLLVHMEQLLTEDLRITGGLRLDFNSITPLTLSPRLAGVFRLAQSQFLRLALGQAFRKPAFINSSVHIKPLKTEPAFPEFKDFFLRSIGNEDVGNESVTTLEAGYQGRFFDSAMAVEADLFYNRYRDTITFNLEMRTSLGRPDLLNSVAEYRNTGREIDSLGGSISLTYRFQKALLLNINYTYRYSFYTSDPSGLTATLEGRKGERVPWEPAHLANLNLHYLAESGIRLGVGWHAASSRVGLISTGGAFDQRINLRQPASCFLSGFVSWRFATASHAVEVGIRAYNLLEQPFRDLPGQFEGSLGGQVISRLIFLFIRGEI